MSDFRMPEKKCADPNPHQWHTWHESEGIHTTRFRCSGRTFKEAVEGVLHEQTPLVDNVPMTMGGQAVNVGLPGFGEPFWIRRDDCYNSTPHMSHTWTIGDSDEGKEERVFCLGLDANGRRPDNSHSDDFPDRIVNVDVDIPEAFTTKSGVTAINSDAVSEFAKENLYVEVDQIHGDCVACGTGTTDTHGDHAPDGGDDPTQKKMTIDGQEVVGIDPELIPGDAQNGIYAMDPGKTIGTAVTRWADEAMFKAEEIDATAGPRVYLLWMTPDPLGAISAACKMYKGEVVRDLSTITDAERLEYFEQVQRTKLKAPFEFVKFHFMIEGVTRAFTHQMVRQRTAAYAQESLRFAVKEDMPVGLPPSLAGTEEAWESAELTSDDIEADKDLYMRAEWESAISHIRSAYNRLIEMGVPAEDARGLLPHNVLTRLHYTTDLRALLDHAGNRLCTQAQFEWRLVFSRIMEAIRDTGIARNYGWIRGVPFKADDANGTSRVWMARELLDAFRPVCFQTGKCEFKANFDRHCSIRERVNAFEKHGVPSDEWEQGKDFGPESRNVFLGDILPWSDRKSGNQIIPGIKPGEWLLDSGAARKKAR